MKTTVEISDALLREVKLYAARHGISMREVFEQALRSTLRGSPRSSKKFRMKSVTTKGQGLVCSDDWSTIRSLIYEGHGG